MTLDAAAFEIIERKRRLSRQTLEIAKRRLLHGERALDLAAAHRVKTQRIYTIEQQVRAAWAEVTLIAPKTLIAEFEQQIEQAGKRLAARRAAKR